MELNSGNDWNLFYLGLSGDSDPYAFQLEEERWQWGRYAETGTTGTTEKRTSVVLFLFVLSECKMYRRLEIGR